MCVTLYRVCSCGLLCYRILIATSWLPLLFLRLLPLSLSHLIWLPSHWCWCLFLWLCLRLLWHVCCFINDFAIYLNSLPISLIVTYILSTQSVMWCCFIVVYMISIETACIYLLFQDFSFVLLWCVLLVCRFLLQCLWCLLLFHWFLFLLLILCVPRWFHWFSVLCIWCVFQKSVGALTLNIPKYTSSYFKRQEVWELSL